MTTTVVKNDENGKQQCYENDNLKLKMKHQHDHDNKSEKENTKIRSEYTPFCPFLRYFQKNITTLFCLWERKGRNTAIFGPTVFFPAVRPHGSTACCNFSLLILAKKTAKKTKKTSKTRSDIGKGSCTNIADQTWGTEKVFQ